MGNKDVKTNSGTDDLNIFDEFNSNEDLKKEIEELKEEKKRDFYYYAINIGSFFKIINLLLFLLFSLLYVYFYLQDKDDLSESNILNPVCNIFLGDSAPNSGYCSSISYALKVKKEELDKIKLDNFLKVIEILPKVYSSLNWYDGEEISFLVDKTKNKLRPIKIIEEFDTILNNFEPADRKKIECNNINITDDFIFTIDCTVKTRGYERTIVGFKGDKSEKSLVSGTSISLAASFINYINKKSKGRFILIDFPRDFNSTDSDLKDGYSKETSFTLKLQYDNNNLLFKN